MYRQLVDASCSDIAIGDMSTSVYQSVPTSDSIIYKAAQAPHRDFLAFPESPALQILVAFFAIIIYLLLEVQFYDIVNLSRPERSWPAVGYEFAVFLFVLLAGAWFLHFVSLYKHVTK